MYSFKSCLKQWHSNILCPSTEPTKYVITFKILSDECIGFGAIKILQSST